MMKNLNKRVRRERRNFKNKDRLNVMSRLTLGGIWMGLCRIEAVLCCMCTGGRAVWVGGGTAVMMGAGGLQSVGPKEKGGPN